MALRLVLAEDNLLVREGLEQLLAGADGLEIVAACADLDALREAIAEHKPDVVITDIRMPPTRTDEGIRVAEQLRESDPEVGVVVLSQYSEPAYVLKLLEAGSDRRGYLLKERIHDRGQLSTAIRTVAEGGSSIDPKLVEVLISGRAAVERSPLRDLTAREREVLAEIAEGKNNAAIAQSLVLTKRAVEKHINSIFTKLGLADAQDVSKRVKAALLFLSDPSPRE
jgi:DNA-binding NarL/FixJ family response regulator